MKQWRGFVAGVCCTLLAAFLAVTAGARTGKVMQELTYRDIRVSLDGEVLDLRNAVGDKVEPFMFDGTNYLPVRALAEALGLDVAWNGAEVMVVLTTPEPEPVPAPEPQTELEPVQEAEPSAKTPTPKVSSGGGGEEENFYTWDIPENEKTDARYVLNLRSLKIHAPDCRTVHLIAPQDYATSDKPLAELLLEGYTVCGLCGAD